MSVTIVPNNGGLYLGQVSVSNLPSPSSSNGISFVSYGNGTQTGQSGTEITMIPLQTVTLTKNVFLYQVYFELYSNNGSTSTYTLYLDGTAIQSFTAGFSTGFWRTPYNYTFYGTTTPGSHTLEVKASDSIGLNTDGADCWQFLLTETA